MSGRKFAPALIAACAALLLLPMAAAAQSPSTHATSVRNVPITGKAQNGKTFTGHYTITQFVTRGGKTYAIGQLTGTIGNRQVSRSGVAIPLTVAHNGSATSSSVRAGAAATCPILHLDLGPLTLNLLGLNVHLNEVVLDITATSGPGNLLGNLLCGVAHLLDGQTLAAQQVSGLLNIVQQLLNVPGLLNL